MTQATHHQTAPEDRIPLAQKLVYGAGAFVNNLLADSLGRLLIVLNLGLGVDPGLAGLVASLPRVVDAITDPLMGYISDHTRSRWGRRRPYIFFGAIAAGILFAVLWQLPPGKEEWFYFWFFLSGSLLFFLAYTMFATPWVALGYELTPDYHERTRLMGIQNFIGQFPYMITPFFLVFIQDGRFFTDMVQGTSVLAIIIGVFTIAVGILPAIFLRERFTMAQTEAPAGSNHAQQGLKRSALVENIVDFFKAFWITIKFVPFLKLCAATFLVFNGFMLIASFQSYVIIYFVTGGDTVAGAKWVGWSGSLQAMSTLVIIFIVTWLSTHLGKRRAFFVAIGLSMVGYAMKWVCYNPNYPWLVLVPAPFLAFGLGGLFTLMPSMIADVVDMDELKTHQRREGMYGSIFWWVVKVGMAAALAAGGFLLNATGFDVALQSGQTEQTILNMRLCDVIIPMITSALAIWAIASFSITEERAYEVRRELEARRGGSGDLIPEPA